MTTHRILAVLIAIFCFLTISESVDAMYHARLGRFIQRDPIGYPDGLNSYAGYHIMHGDTDPKGLHRYGEWVFINKTGRGYTGRGRFVGSLLEYTGQDDLKSACTCDLVITLRLKFKFGDYVFNRKANQREFVPRRWNPAAERAFKEKFMSIIMDTWDQPPFKIVLSSGSPEQCPCSWGTSLRLSLAEYDSATADVSDSIVTVRVADASKEFRTTSAATTGSSGDIFVRWGHEGWNTFPHFTAHEVGHIWGLYDEYQGAPRTLPPFYDDTTSIMNRGGGEVRARHLVSFSDFMSKQISGCEYAVQDSTGELLDGTDPDINLPQ